MFPDLLALPTEYIALNNLGSFTLNAIRFESLGSNSPAAATVQARAAAGFTLRFAADGAIQPSILVNGTAPCGLRTAWLTTGITLTDGTNLMMGGTGLGRLELAANIGQATGGVGRVTYNHAGPFTFAAGQFAVVSGANTYSGGTSIVRGNVEANSNGAFGDRSREHRRHGAFVGLYHLRVRHCQPLCPEPIAANRWPPRHHNLFRSVQRPRRPGDRLAPDQRKHRS